VISGIQKKGAATFETLRRSDRSNTKGEGEEGGQEEAEEEEGKEGGGEEKGEKGGEE